MVVLDQNTRLEEETKIKSYRGFKVVALDEQFKRILICGGVEELEKDSKSSKKVYFETSPCFEYYGFSNSLARRSNMTT